MRKMRSLMLIFHLRNLRNLRNLRLLLLLLLTSAVMAGERAWQPETFPISYWCGPPPQFTTIERYREIKDAGFTVVFPPCGGATPELNHKILGFCKELGLRAFVQDPHMPLAIGGDAKPKAAIDAIVREYADESALAGYFITDEPGAGAFEGLSEVVAALRERDPKHVAFVNLLPNYATPAQLGAATYDGYVRGFIERVKPFAISYDHYTFAAGNAQSFYDQIKAVRSITNDAKLPFWNIVLAVQHGPYRNLTEPELRWQAMNTLAFGGKGLLWFTYWSPGGMDKSFEWQHAMINPDGTKDPHYEMIAKINRDVRAIGDELLGATSLDVYTPPEVRPTTRSTTAAASTPNSELRVGWFRSADGTKNLLLMVNQNTRQSATSGAVQEKDLPPPYAGYELFDPSTRKWQPVRSGPVPDIAPGGGMLFRINEFPSDNGPIPSPPRAAATQPRAQKDPALDTIRSRFVLSMMPPTDELAADIIDKAHKRAAELKADATWPDLDYADQGRARWPLGEHLGRTLLMARASYILRDRNTPEEQLDAKTIAALDWWLDHDLKNPNWWWNEIGVPQFLGEISIFMQPKLSPKRLDDVVKIMRRSVWTKWTGQNLVWGTQIQILRGLLIGDAAAVREAYARMYDEIRIVKQPEDGIQADFSFHQHGQQLYNGGYGLGFGNDVGRFVAHAWGTPYQIPPDKLQIYLGYLLDGQQWMVFEDLFDFSATGREIIREGKVAVNRKWSGGPISPAGAAYGMANVVRQLASLDVPRKPELVAFAKRLEGAPDQQPLVGNRHYYCSDYMVHRGAHSLMSIKMFSDRMINAELVNTEGKKSHHLSDGATLIYNDGDEYRDIWPVWDWQQVPGTTAEQAPDGVLDKLLPKGNHERGQTSFVGGVSNGRLGVAAMDLKRGKLTAKKAWFCFEDRVVCLGAGINCDSDNDVVTCVNQCLTTNSSDVQQGDNWVWHRNVGYVFPAGAKFVLSTGEQSGKWSDLGPVQSPLIKKPVFKLTLDHGTRPRDGTYQCVVLPYGRADETRAAAQASPIEVFSNTTTLQAVRDGEHAMGIVFRQAGEARGGGGGGGGGGWNVAVDRPCLVLLEQRDDGLHVSVSNPESQPATVNVTIDRAVHGDGATVDGNGTRIQFDLPGGLIAGSTVTKVLAA
jgi:chondroitin AC lyase